MLYCPQHCEIRFVQHYVQWGMVKYIRRICRTFDTPHSTHGVWVC